MTERPHSTIVPDFETRYRALADAAHDSIFIIGRDYRFEYLNLAAAEQFDRRPADLVGASVDTCFPPGVAARVKAEVRRVRDTRVPLYSEQPMPFHGKESWQSAWLVPVADHEGEGISVMGIARDITERRRLETQLERQNSLLNATIENSPDGILSVDTELKVLSYNSRFSQMWGLPADLLAQDSDALLLQAASAQVKNPQAFLEGIAFYYDHPCESGHDELELINGRTYDRHTVPLFGADQTRVGRIWFFRDITEQKTAVRTAAMLARTDGLTGLANRRAFIERLSLALAEAKRGGRAFAVLYFDLDYFKDVNDILGHPIGDALLSEVAHRLKSSTRDTDVIARFGGDEFAVLQTNADDAVAAAETAKKISRIVEDTYVLEGNTIHITASMGIVTYSSDVDDPESLMRRADLALYRAKDEGRHCYRFHDRGLEEIVRERVALADDLHRALAQNEFELFFQPEVDIRSGRIVGLESLVRWNHPTRGLLEPRTFVPAAERTGLIVALGRWAFDAACRQRRLWLDQGIVPPTLAVNVSALQFKGQGDLERDVAASLAKWQISAADMELELTETVLMEVSQKNQDALEGLRRMGLTLAIDDFGTGYSSLGYLSLYPVNYLKIAQELVLHAPTDHRSATVVRAAIRLAHELGIQAIAEGVESETHVSFLNAADCNLAQGFHFGRPLTAALTGNLLRAHDTAALLDRAQTV